MNREMVEDSAEASQRYVTQEGVNYGYDTSYMNYAAPTTSTQINQPLPGQPPLPPMPPPSAAVPTSNVFSAMQSQVAQIAWAQATPSWPWFAQSPPPLTPQGPREIMAGVFSRDMPMRNNYTRRERYNNNRNNVYDKRGNYHRKSRRRFDPTQNQFEQAQYYGTAIPGKLGIDWQRGNFVGVTNEALMNHVGVSLTNHQLAHLAQGANAVRHNNNESADQDVKIVAEDVVVKKNKQRKPMSQSYPSRPWNREDAERALKIENEYNKTVKAQSLIIKFPDPDLNKDIVRKFHSGIQNIHFQSPSAPRYCFIQIAENVDIEEAIKELEMIPFGTGHLKVERKSLRDEDNPSPEEIDPYTLYIGNLPESVNVNEVKSKFPSALRVDVGYAQKVRNTRYAFVRYNNVEDSTAAYKKALDLMWDTRSIIVRFRRQRGNTCLPGEPKDNPKKDKDTKTAIAKTEVKEESSNNEKNHIEAVTNVQKKADVNNAPQTTLSNDSQTNNQNAKEPEKKSDQQLTLLPVPPPPPPKEDGSNFIYVDIKVEPEDYDEMMDDMQDEDDVDEDEDDDDDEEDDAIEDDYEEDSVEEDGIDFTMDFKKVPLEKKSNTDDIPPDGLDKMFSDIDNIGKDISL